MFYIEILLDCPNFL